jgi:hypothetical protein
VQSQKLYFTQKGSQEAKEPPIRYHQLRPRAWPFSYSFCLAVIKRVLLGQKMRASRHAVLSTPPIINLERIPPFLSQTFLFSELKFSKRENIK